ncbi:MAG: hypothetical protein OXU54_05710 [Gammaproteobacteria bacterium]|nr:hypothetical protein [Gammaproteobacteria bacterium]
MTQANMELLDALRDAGAADDKARAAAQSVATVGNVATKEDITAVRADMAAMESGIRAEMAAVRADMAAMESRLIRWVVGMIFPQYALLAFVALRLPW